MCVIAAIYQSSAPISDEHWENCWDGNPDGFGMMWVDNGVIQMFKSLHKDTAWERSKEVIRDFHDISPIIMHWRIGTQGVGLDNCHPFFVNDRIAFCHNGIISQFSTQADRKTGRSDTRLFNEYILSCLNDGFENNGTTVDLIEDYVGSDKLVFLDRDGVVTIMNSKYGVYDKDTKTWFSNSSYKHEKIHFTSKSMFSTPKKANENVVDTKITILYMGKKITTHVSKLSTATAVELGLLFKEADDTKKVCDNVAIGEKFIDSAGVKYRVIEVDSEPNCFVKMTLAEGGTGFFWVAREKLLSSYKSVKNNGIYDIVSPGTRVSVTYGTTVTYYIVSSKTTDTKGRRTINVRSIVNCRNEITYTDVAFNSIFKLTEAVV